MAVARLVRGEIVVGPSPPSYHWYSTKKETNAPRAAATTERVADVLLAKPLPQTWGAYQFEGEYEAGKQIQVVLVLGHSPQLPMAFR